MTIEREKIGKEEMLTGGDRWNSKMSKTVREERNKKPEFKKKGKRKRKESE